MITVVLKQSLRKIAWISRSFKLIVGAGALFVLFVFGLSIFVDGSLGYLRAQPQEIIALPSDVKSKKSNNKSSRILCYVLISPKKLDAAETIKGTWGSRCDKLIFYGRFNNSDLPVTYIDASEGYRFLWGKTQAAILHLNSTYSLNYDWFLKADDDTFIVLENLRHFVKNLDSNDAQWFGYKLKHPQVPQGYMSGGAGYVFSQAALREVAKLLSVKLENPKIAKCRAGLPIGLEDLELGRCFAVANVKGVSTADDKMRERFLPLPVESLWKKKVPIYHWIWRQAWNPLKIGHECCSPQIISTHQNSPVKMQEMYNALYTNDVSKNVLLSK